MLRRLYDWTMALAGHRHASVALGAVSFIESSFFPIPPDALLIPMVLADRKSWFWYAALCTLTSVAGGIAGYFIGALLFEEVAKPILQMYGYSNQFNAFAAKYNDWGIWIVVIAGVTPFPYKVVTIASGATGLNLPIFVLASFASRGFRFFLVSALLYYAGPTIREFIERRLGLLFTLFMALLLGGFVAARYLL